MNNSFPGQANGYLNIDAPPDRLQAGSYNWAAGAPAKSFCAFCAFCGHPRLTPPSRAFVPFVVKKICFVCSGSSGVPPSVLSIPPVKPSQVSRAFGLSAAHAAASFAPQPHAAVPYSHAIHPAKRMIIQRFDGMLSLTTVCEGTEKLWSDPQYDPGFDGITDLSHSVVSGNVEDVRALSRFIANRQKASTGRWAVVTNDPKITAFVLVFGRLLAKPTLSVFSTWAAATAFMQFDTPPPK